MIYTIDFENIDIRQILVSAIKSEIKSNLFSDIQRLLQIQIEEALLNSGLIVTKELQGNSYARGELINVEPIKNSYGELLDVEFCNKYGVDKEAMSAINYYCSHFKNIPSLDTLKRFPEFSFGNFYFELENENITIEIKKNSKIKITGYSFSNETKWKKTNVIFYGIRFNYNLVLDIVKELENENIDFIPVETRLGYVTYPTFFIDQISGEFYCCSCFKGKIDWQNDFFRFNNFDYENEIKKRIENVKYKDKICHICTEKVPEYTYGSEMYYNSFVQRYLPYFYLNSKILTGSIFSSDKQQEFETELREKLDYPSAKRKNKWISETIVYKIVQEFFPNNEIIFHYRNKELNRLELDIFVPHIKLGIEYQGIQHFEEISHWGGKKGLRKRLQNDYEKKQRCIDVGYNLVYLDYSEFINRSSILDKIFKYINSVPKELKNTNLKSSIPDNWINYLGELDINTKKISILMKDMKKYRIKSILPLSVFSFLEKIILNTSMFKDEIFDLTFFIKFRYLRELKIQNNEIRSLKGIEEIKLLKKIQLRGNKIRSLAPLKKTLNIQNIDISNNKIKNIEPIKHISDCITHLDISENKIISIKPIIEKTALEYLKLSGNNIPDSEIESFRKLNPKCRIIMT